MKMVTEYRVVSLPGGVYVEWRSVGDDGSSGQWKTTKKQREYWESKNFRSRGAAERYVNEKVNAGRGVWEGNAMSYFDTLRQKEEERSRVQWSDADLKRLEFAKWLVTRAKLSEEVAEEQTSGVSGR